MSQEWLLNFMGANLPEEHLQRVSNPRLELAAHTTMGLMQIGALTGTAVFGPCAAIYAAGTNLNLRHLSTRVFRYGAGGILVGLALGPGLSLLRCRTKTLEEIKYHCYRIRCDREQLRADRTSILGAVLGTSAALVLRQRFIPLVVFGFCFGMLTGDMYNMLTHEDKYMEFGAPAPS